MDDIPPIQMLSAVTCCRLESSQSKIVFETKTALPVGLRLCREHHRLARRALRAQKREADEGGQLAYSS